MVTREIFVHPLSWLPNVVDGKEDYSRLATSINLYWPIPPSETQCVDMHLHLTAIEVCIDEDGLQVAVNNDHAEEFEQWSTAAGDDGRYRTVDIGGRTYVVFASPWCG